MNAKRKVYIVNGFPKSGKTTLGSIAKDFLMEEGVSFLHLSSIDLVKHLILDPSKHMYEIIPFERYDWLMKIKRSIAYDNCWSGEEKDKDDYWRWVMSEIKIKITEEDPTFLPEYLFQKTSKLSEPWVVFIDIREPENIQFVVEYYKDRYDVEVETILVRSDREVRSDNKSDNSVLEFPYTYEIQNDWANIRGVEGYSVFRAKVARFVYGKILGYGDVDLERLT